MKICATRDAQQIVVKIMDQGIGIEENRQSAIFENFEPWKNFNPPVSLECPHVLSMIKILSY